VGEKNLKNEEDSSEEIMFPTSYKERIIFSELDTKYIGE